MKQSWEYPRESWKTYRVHYTGGMFPYQDTEAPNKTHARMMLSGELRPGLKITKIEEMVIIDGVKVPAHQARDAEKPSVIDAIRAGVPSQQKKRDSKPKAFER